MRSNSWKKKLGLHYDSNSTAELAVALEFMPLVIIQSTAYICQRTPRCSVWQYVEKFQKIIRRKSVYLTSKVGSCNRMSRQRTRSLLHGRYRSTIYVTPTPQQPTYFHSLALLTGKESLKPYFGDIASRPTTCTSMGKIIKDIVSKLWIKITEAQTTKEAPTVTIC